MQSYIFKRLLLMLPTLLGVVLINFAIIQFVPGGPIEQFIAKSRHQMGGEVASGDMSRAMRKGLDEEQINELKKLYEFDQPWPVRLGRWTYKLFTFQFGESYFHHKSVMELVRDKMPVSLWLGITSFFLTYALCIPLGVAKAVRQGTPFDVTTSVLVLVGYSMPGFVLGVLLIWLLGGGSFWDVFPIAGLHSDDYLTRDLWGRIKDTLHHLALPLICLNIGSFAVMTSLTKNTVVDNMGQQYVLTARAKGVKETWVIWRHVFRNSMIPLVTGFAGSFLTMFFTGSLLIETLFSLDGLGLLSYRSVMARDYPVVMATQFFFSILFVVGNLLSDMMYVMVDPRISFEQVAE
ncbi:MAG: ABC transporter permease subunit [Deltaproteobacteria bacterium]|nr:ABC transporter permease subunit [Deltaproteobacteria bacterium]